MERSRAAVPRPVLARQTSVVCEMLEKICEYNEVGDVKKHPDYSSEEDKSSLKLHTKSQATASCVNISFGLQIGTICHRLLVLARSLCVHTDMCSEVLFQWSCFI